MTDQTQATLWNGAVGGAWVRHADFFDATLAPFGDAVIAALHLEPDERVLDVGCGTGATTRAIATAVPSGSVVGIDISEPMLGLARTRAAEESLTNIEFVSADVQAAPLGSAPFDVAFSRFGVMFFEHRVAAFTNICRSMRPGGRIGFICFQGLADNPFIFTPVMAAATHLTMPPLPGPDDPGPFSLADIATIERVLGEAGFIAIAAQAGPDEATLHGADALDALATRVLEQNPASAAGLAMASPDAQQAAIIATANALRPFVDGGTATLGAATWIVTATSPTA